MAVVTTTVRPMTGADVSAVADLEAVSFSQPWSESVLREELAGGNRMYLVAEHGDGRVVGYAGMLVTAGKAHVMTLAVDPSERRRGIGTRLVVALAEAAISGGADRLKLEVRSANGAAIRLYRRFGFEPAGIRPRYYLDDDAVVMWALDIREGRYRALLDRLARAGA